jgi:very-short-patch-repair endonuclease
MIKCDCCGKSFKNPGGYRRHNEKCCIVSDITNEVLNLYLNDLYSINDLKKKFGVGTEIINRILGDKKRTHIQGVSIAHKRYPEKFLHSEETKEKIRIKRIEFMKKNPDKTAWRASNLSYPEKLFLDKLNELKWGEKYSIIREFSVFPFFIDFAFVNEKVAIEIDGSQHLLEERKEKDNEKDDLLLKNGWSVVRITDKEVKTNLNGVMEKISDILNNNPSSQKYSLGILSPLKRVVKKEKNIFGFTKSQIEGHLSQRKIERPGYEKLKQEIKEFGFIKTGKKYGVSDNAIRKWLKFYEKTKGNF